MKKGTSEKRRPPILGLKTTNIHHDGTLYTLASGTSLPGASFDGDWFGLVPADQCLPLRSTVTSPEALQITDRFHLMKNLRDAFARILEGRTSEIRSAFRPSACFGCA